MSPTCLAYVFLTYIWEDPWVDEYLQQEKFIRNFF